MSAKRQKKKNYDKFGRFMYRYYRDQEFFFGSEESLDILSIAKECGLAEEVVYDPKIHAGVDESEPGEKIWRWR